MRLSPGKMHPEWQKNNKVPTYSGRLFNYLVNKKVNNVHKQEKINA